MQENTEMLELLQNMIHMPTANPPGDEQALAEYLADYLKARGIQAWVQPVKENRANLCAALGTGKGPTLVFNGHLDVVPPGHGWQHDPYLAVEEAGRIYGRGSCDMKGAVAAMIIAACQLKAEGFPFQGTLKLAFVADEECDNIGTHTFLDSSDGKADFAVVGEPSQMQICIAHKGVERFHVKCHGLATHASAPQRGRNAIMLAAKAVQAVEEYHWILQERHHPLVGTPSAVVTLIEGGQKDNVVPDLCSFVVDRRILPGEDQASALGELKEALKKALGEDAARVEVEPYLNLGAAEISAEDPFVRKAAGVWERCFNAPCQIQGFPRLL